ncbi:helix-hairpin-helix domain-containing protein [Candidatus Borrarchaeum sp.]|uniref:helix-hairpin-helix domain-containing protein n=1 Tax=Candidatus Borrarchaeum sp. TaxID=2846742 RepID=UPI00257E4DB5|nr:helix-hairpin-helix domain-containing protein [Candidatus Borrarchaeum sp.]
MSSEWTIDDRFTFQTRVICHHCGEILSFNQPGYNKLDKFPATCPKCEGNWGIGNKDYHYSKNYWALRAEPLKRKIKEKTKKARKKAVEQELEELEDLEAELEALGEEEIEAELDELVEEELEEVPEERLSEAEIAEISKEFMQLDGIGKKSAEKIISLGVTSIEELATLEVDMVAETADVSTKSLRKWIKNAQKYLEEEEEEGEDEEEIDLTDLEAELEALGAEEDLEDEDLEDEDLD